MPDHDLLGRAVQAMSLDLDARDISDAIWLAVVAPIGSAATAAEISPPTPELEQDEPSAPVPTKVAVISQPSQPAERRRRAPVRSTGNRTRIARIGSASALPGPLEMTRALRAFKRRWPAGRRQELDLDATIAEYGRTFKFTPLFRLAPERWFDVAVLVDTSPSMAVWQEPVRDFTGILRTLGAFRSVQAIRLSFDRDRLRLHSSDDRPVPVASLRSPDGRRLILLVSDCSATGWYRNQTWQQLCDMARSTPTVVANPLPRSLWRQTGLSFPAVRVSTQMPGNPNSRLSYRAPTVLRLLGESAGTWVPIPTLALTPRSVRTWADALMRTDPLGCDAVLVPADDHLEPVVAAPEPLGGIGLVDAFRYIASDAAFRLAVLCSPFDQISIPLLNVIRKEMLPQATTSDIAEFLVGGLVTAEPTDSSPVFRLRAEVREGLTAKLSARDAWLTYNALNRHVRRNHAVAGDLPVAYANQDDDVELFVAASEATLRVLGALDPVPQTENAVKDTAAHQASGDLSAKDGAAAMVRLVRESFAVAEPELEKTAQFFYGLLFSLAPELRDLFPSNMNTQRSRLLRALVHVIQLADRPDDLVPFLRQLGRDHRKFGVRAEHYETFGTALISAVKRSASSSWSPETERSWAELFTVMARAMKDAADAETDPPWWSATVISHKLTSRSVAVVRLEPEFPVPYRPGQYICAEVPQRPRMWRYFSPANAPSLDRVIELHVRAVEGGWVSRSIVEQTRRGDRWRIGQPMGRLSVDRAGQRSVLMVAGGTGLAPMRALIQDMITWKVPRRVQLFFGARTFDDLYDLAYVQQLAATHRWLTVVPVVESGAPVGCEFGTLADVVTRYGAWDDHDVLVAGSPQMIRATVSRMLVAGTPLVNITYDPFTLD